MPEPTRISRADWFIPAALLLLSIVPLLAGAVRLGGLTGDGAMTPENARFLADPVPVAVHIAASAIYCVFGAFQFSPAVRRLYPRWHRMAGRVLIPSGLVAALSGLWMTQFYALPLLDQSTALYAIRMAAGAAMAIAIVQGFCAIRRRDFGAHRAWMIRAYALGIGAGTQVFTHIPWFVLGVDLDVTSRAIAMGAGWLINIVVAEWIIKSARPALRANP